MTDNLTPNISPIWDHFNGELFQDLISDLLAAENFVVEPSGVGPDGGVDIIATEKIRFGYNPPGPFVWAVQCKFSSKSQSITPGKIGEIGNVVADERFKDKKLSGYLLATNVRLSTNLMSRLRGLNDFIPGFKTTFIDRSRLHGLLIKHPNIYKKYLPKLRIVHLVFGQKSYGGIETYIEGIRTYSKHIHIIKPILSSGTVYPADYKIFKYASEATIIDLGLLRKKSDQTGRVFGNVIDFINKLPLRKKDKGTFEEIKRNIEIVLSELGGFDIVHSHFFIPAFLSQEKNYPTLFTSHSILSRDFYEEEDYEDYKNCKNDEIEKFKCIDNIVTLSKFHTNEVKKIGAIKPLLMKPIFNIQNFDNPSIVNMSSFEARKLIKIAEKFTVLFLGRPVIRKGLEVLIKALNEMNIESLQLAILGRGFEYDNLTQTISYRSGDIDRKIQSKATCILMEKLQSDSVALFYKAADVVVCPSLYEPFGFINLEAMIAKRAIISSDIDGISEYVQNGKTGLLFQKGNICELKEKIELLYRNKDIRTNLGENGYKYIKNEFKPMDIIDELDTVYEKIHKKYLNSN